MNANERPIILAQNWDRFGGRCHELFNALLVSKILDCRFGFEWSEAEMFPEVSAQLSFFSPDFVHEYLCPEPTADVAVLYLDKTKSAETLRREMSNSGHTKFRIGNFFEVPLVQNVDCFEMFAALGDEIWSVDSKSLASQIEKQLRQLGTLGTIHIRSGDLVDGDWNQYPATDKFIPFAVIDEYLEINKDSKFVLISDSSSIIEALIGRHRNVISSHDVVVASKVSTSNSEILDIMILKESEKVIGPENSAFSKLGAHLAGFEPTVIYADFSDSNWDNALQKAISPATYASFSGEFSALLQARDINWIIDRRSSKLSVSNLVAAARHSRDLDPRNVIALCQESTASLLAGQKTKAVRLANRAIRAARPSRRIHGDPSYYALCVKIVSKILILASQGKRKTSTLRTRLKKRRIRQIMKELSTMSIYQVPRIQIQTNLHEAIKTLFADLDQASSFPNARRLQSLFTQNFFDQSQHEHFLTHLTGSISAAFVSESREGKE